MNEVNSSTECVGCGLSAASINAPLPVHPKASAECFALYTHLLARSYQDPAYQHVHQLIVDAYNTQHPEGTDNRTIQGVGVCLMTLCLFLENGVDPREGPRLHKAMTQNPVFTWLKPPRLHGLMTVADIVTATDPREHERLLWEWGRQVWQAWAPHHHEIRQWITRGGYRT
ncbi:hypothetical protein E4U91_35745 [Streptomyces lasalocidi]|uniref:Uncharacterized protein n=1 Tax=Streptomyces lasalocidi TaxID=324833 RepID=A0A4U5W423_STRLS|nr:hypothetical protein E4U91_35745 [Streptomyces lasalocidi]